jgi:hypothetical protein
MSLVRFAARGSVRAAADQVGTAGHLSISTLNVSRLLSTQVFCKSARLASHRSQTWLLAAGNLLSSKPFLSASIERIRLSALSVLFCCTVPKYIFFTGEHIMDHEKINEMADAIVAANATTREEIVAALNAYWAGKMAIVWERSDVLGKAWARGMLLTNGQADELLDDMRCHHDPELGITWTTIECALDETEPLDI